MNNFEFCNENYLKVKDGIKDLNNPIVYTNKKDFMADNNCLHPQSLCNETCFKVCEILNYFDELEEGKRKGLQRLPTENTFYSEEEALKDNLISEEQEDNKFIKGKGPSYKPKKRRNYST